MANDELSINPTLNSDLLNLANFIITELQGASPYNHGGMRASITLIKIDNGTIDIAIAVDYASYVDCLPMIGGTRAGTITKHPKPPHANKNYHWVEKVVERCINAYAQSHADDTSMRTGIDFKVIQGVKGN